MKDVLHIRIVPENHYSNLKNKFVDDTRNCQLYYRLY